MEILDDDKDIGGDFEFLFEGEKHNVGIESDYDNGTFFDFVFYLDGQQFDSFEKFKAQAVLNGRLFSQRVEEIEITEINKGDDPEYVKLEPYRIKVDAQE